MVSDRTASDAAQQLASLLEAHDVPYAIGGALALAVAGVPRGTADVDINVFVELDRLSELISLLSSLGVVLDPESARIRAQRDGMFVGRWDGMRIDVFLPSIEFAREAERTRIRVTGPDGWSGWFLSPEALAVFKLLFFRGKDIVDLERLVAVRPDLDRGWIRAHIAEMMGDDERVQKWDELVARFGAI